MAGCKAYASTAGFGIDMRSNVFQETYPDGSGTYRTRMQCIRCDAERGRNRGRNIHLKRLLDFSKEYQPNFKFTYWVQSAESIILNELESLAPTHFEEHMYMVEEFV